MDKALVIRTFLAALISALAYTVIALPISQKNKWSLKLIIKRGVMFTLLGAGLAYKIMAFMGSDPVPRPFDSWIRISEFGYKAIWIEMAANMLPFVPFGIALPIAYRRINSMRYALLCGMGAGAAVGVMTYALDCFHADAVTGAIAGTLAGFSLLTFFAWIFTGLSFVKKLKLTNMTHTFGVFYLLFIYLCGVSALLMDNGSSTFVPLSIFTPDQPLPQSTTITAPVNDAEGRAMTYTTAPFDIEEYAKSISMACGAVGDVAQSGQYGREVVNGTRKVTVSQTGEWRYTDTAVQVGPVSDNDAIESAIHFVTGDLLNNFTIAGSSTEKLTNGEDQTGVLVYLEMGIEGKRICGSCEIALKVGKGAEVAEAVKNNAYFEEFKNVKIISSAEAFERVKKGEGGHTLFQSARSAVLHTAEIGYWLEETKGMLQPIWLFKGTAKLDDGNEQEFEVYIPAMK